MKYFNVKNNISRKKQIDMYICKLNGKDKYNNKIQILFYFLKFLQKCKFGFTFGDKLCL